MDQESIIDMFEAELEEKPVVIILTATEMPDEYYADVFYAHEKRQFLINYDSTTNKVQFYENPIETGDSKDQERLREEPDSTTNP